MSRLIYTAITSLDGYVADANGNFDWAAPDEEVHGLVNELERPIGMYLYGRRMYEVMVPWEDMPIEGQSQAVKEYAEIWRAADKVAFSRSLAGPRSAKTRIEREFNPDEVRRMKESASSDLSVAGPELAGQAIRAGLVDELRLFVNPVVVGGGTSAFPSDVRWDLELLGERRFASGVVFLQYRPR